MRTYGPSNADATRPVNASTLTIISAVNADEVSTLSVDPDRGRPLLLVRLVTVADDLEGTIEYFATAWTGGPPAGPARRSSCWRPCRSR